MLLKIVGTKDPILRQKAKPVKTIDKKIASLISDMRETLEVQLEPEGVGLAAPQVGKSLRLFVVNYEKLKRVVINPSIVSVSRQKSLTSTKKDDILEGCLSLPNYYSPIKRATSITISYTNEKGENIVETFNGFDSQIIQHELEHLDGILFVDKVISEKLPIYKLTGKKWEEIELV
jgi:peptide deformylase